MAGVFAVMALSIIPISNHVGSSSSKAGMASIESEAGPILSARLRDLRPALRTAQARYSIRAFRGSARRGAPLPPILAPYGRLADALGLFRRAGTTLTQFVFPSVYAIPAADRNFDGIGQGFSGPGGTFSVAGAPPDPNGDVGPNHYVQVVNTDLAVFDKNGVPIYGPVPINTLWSGFGGGCQTNNDGDPTVLYDPMADRWIISQFSVSTTPYLQCVAVSATNDPTGSYYRYAFSYGTDFPDYSKIGVWPDAYYITFNIFTNGQAFAGAEICAYDRVKMLAGMPATQQCFNTTTSYGGLLPADLDGARQPPAGSPNYIVGLGAAPNSLAFWKFHVDWTTPASSSFTGPMTLATAAYSEACGGGRCIPQSGTTQRLDSLGDRLMYRLAYRNFGDHESLVVNHSVVAGSSVGVRWYELRVAATGAGLSMFQQGTYAPNSNYRWMGSLAMDQAGNMALGYSVSSSFLHPQIRYTGRLAGDPAGQMTQGEGTLIAGGGSQLATLSRWGDYSMMAVDPGDDCTFWYTNQYLPTNGKFNWKTRIGTFKFPSCGPVTNDFSISASPPSVSLAPGASGVSTISTALIAGSAETIALTVSGVPAGATATPSPTSVTAGGSSSLTINAGTATPGSYTLTVTGTSTSAIHATTVTLTVTSGAPVNDFSISASPSSLSLAQGASSPSTISTAVISGNAETISLTVSGVPTGATATLNPTSVTAGGGSTLTINAGTAAAGTYTLTVTGTSASAMHSTSVTLTVTSGASSAVVNGGFETGDLTGWTAIGAASVTTGSHSGIYAAMVGSTSAFNGDSSLTQTFTAPASGGTLAFWYKVVCTDTVTYDWATATLRDNTTNAVTTVLAKTCTNTGTWSQASAPLIGGRSYTLTLIDHDDNYPSDPTYTLFDDVAIGSASPPPNPIVNGGFETGTLSGWTLTGTTSVTTVAHSGAYAALAGGTSQTNGDSSLSQTFTAPSTATTLSLWYATNCPDTVTYDWTTVTLRDNTAGTTTTVVPRTCPTAYVWVNATAGIIAGHSYTLTLINHDDNYPGDSTYTLFDDVAVVGSSPLRFSADGRSTRVKSGDEDEADDRERVRKR